MTPRSLFKGRPASLKLFYTVRDEIKSIGSVDIATTKTQVSFGTKRKFAWIWLPQMWVKEQPEGSVVLSIALRRRVKDRRIKESVEPYPGRFTHHVVLIRASQLDTKVKQWLREAYLDSK